MVQPDLVCTLTKQGPPGSDIRSYRSGVHIPRPMVYRALTAAVGLSPGAGRLPCAWRFRQIDSAMWQSGEENDLAQLTEESIHELLHHW